jgi:hypothetical protein
VVAPTLCNTDCASAFDEHIKNKNNDAKNANGTDFKCLNIEVDFITFMILGEV